MQDSGVPNVFDGPTSTHPLQIVHIPVKVDSKRKVDLWNNKDSEF